MLVACVSRWALTFMTHNAIGTYFANNELKQTYYERFQSVYDSSNVVLQLQSNFNVNTMFPLFVHQLCISFLFTIVPIYLQFRGTHKHTHTAHNQSSGEVVKSETSKEPKQMFFYSSHLSFLLLLLFSLDCPQRGKTDISELMRWFGLVVVFYTANAVYRVFD